jgi:hypothetical protein
MLLGLSGFSENKDGQRGAAGAGKDAVARILHKDFGFVCISFADPIKRVLKDIFKFPDERLWGSSKMRSLPDKRYPRDSKDCPHLTVRYGLTRVGDAFRDCYQDIVVDYAILMAQEILDGLPFGCHEYDPKVGVHKHSILADRKGVVITDCRYPSEVEGVRKAGGKVVRIKRKAENLTGAAAQHSSELSLMNTSDDVFDYVIDNNGDLDDLDGLVASMMGALGWG